MHVTVRPMNFINPQAHSSALDKGRDSMAHVSPARQFV